MSDGVTKLRLGGIYRVEGTQEELMIIARRLENPEDEEAAAIHSYFTFTWGAYRDDGSSLQGSPNLVQIDGTSEEDITLETANKYRSRKGDMFSVIGVLGENSSQFQKHGHTRWGVKIDPTGAAADLHHYTWLSNGKVTEGRLCGDDLIERIHGGCSSEEAVVEVSEENEIEDSINSLVSRAMSIGADVDSPAFKAAIEEIRKTLSPSDDAIPEKTPFVLEAGKVYTACNGDRFQI